MLPSDVPCFIGSYDIFSLFWTEIRDKFSWVEDHLRALDVEHAGLYATIDVVCGPLPGFASFDSRRGAQGSSEDGFT